MAVDDKKQTEEQPHEATCPKCGHHFFHKIGEALKDTAEVAVNTIAKNAQLGGDE